MGLPISAFSRWRQKNCLIPAANLVQRDIVLWFRDFSGYKEEECSRKCFLLWFTPSFSLLLVFSLGWTNIGVRISVLICWCCSCDWLLIRCLRIQWVIPGTRSFTLSYFCSVCALLQCHSLLRVFKENNWCITVLVLAEIPKQLVKESIRNWHVFVKIKVWQGCYLVISIHI